jgi:hypothetical protein
MAAWYPSDQCKDIRRMVPGWATFGPFVTSGVREVADHDQA